MSFRKDHSLLVSTQAPGQDPLMNSKTPVLVKDWLSSGHSGKWLLVLDNADDPEVFGSFNDHGKPLLPYLPRSGNGHVLVTSRFRRVALTLVSSEDTLIHVTPMTSQEAVSLLRTTGPKDRSTESDAIQLANALDCLPLEIKQATGYISATNTSMKEYLRLFSKDDSYRRRLLEKTYGDVCRDTHDDLQDSVILTWQISFDDIRIQRPAAADLPSLMGTLHREAILPELLVDVSVDDLEHQEDVRILVQYSLISRNEDPVSFSMHRLVQLTIRTWLLRQGTLGKWQAEALRLVSNSYTEQFSVERETKDLARCALLEPNAEVVLENSFEAKLEIDRQEELKSNRLAHLYNTIPCPLITKAAE